MMSRGEGGPEAAASLYERGLELWRSGALDDAVEVVGEAVRLAPDEPAFHNAFGALHAILGAPARALAAFRIALCLAPADPAIWSNLGHAAGDSGRTDAALSARGREVALAAPEPAALARLAILRHGRGELAAATRLYRRAIALAPAFVEAWSNLGHARRETGFAPAAIDALRRALSADPGFADARMNLGIVLCDLADWAGAVDALTVASEARPESVLALSNLGSALFRADRPDESRRSSSRALVLDPGHAPTHSNLALLEQAEFAHAAAARHLRRALALGWSAPAHSNLLMQLCYDPATTSEALAAEAGRWAAACAAATGAVPARPTAAGPDRRLRIGWLSADLYEHPVAHNLIGLFEHRDRRQFDAVAYASLRAADATTHRIRSLVDGWRDVVGLDDRAVAELIRADAIDVLVVLAGHTGGNRIGVAAHGPAPLLASFHDLTTSGLPTVDAWLTDWSLHPEGTREHFSESLVRLPCFYLYEPPAAAPAIAASPDREGPPTFGSFNNTSKLSPEILRLWARILAAVPGSRLVFKYHGRFAARRLRERVLGIFADCGVPAGRIVFHADNAERDDHLALLSRTDIALDTFPFNGSTTTFEALWMGVPVVTLAGERFVGRVGASVLARIGLGDLVADTPDAYVAAATRLAADGERRRAFRATARDTLSRSPLCRPEPYARAFEAALRALWRDACRR